jgi:hypothetical protein
MPAGKYNITCEQGATLVRVFTYQNDDESVVNLSGYTASMQVRSTAKSATIITELSTFNNRITIDGDAGTITLTLTAGDTAVLPIVRAVYDLELTAPDSTVLRLLEGTFTVVPEVTR